MKKNRLQKLLSNFGAQNNLNGFPPFEEHLTS